MKWEVRTMRSGKSYFDGTVYKKTIARFWPLWAGYFVIWLISMPLEGLMSIRRQAEAVSDTAGFVSAFANRTVPGMAESSLYLALIFGGLAAMAVFSHLYSARSANLFGSLPIRREGLFLTHYLAGLSFLLAPNAVIFLLTLAVEAAGGCVVMQGLLFWLGATCGECLFFYSLAVFCGMFTGHILALPAFYGIFNVLFSGITVLLQTVCQSFYYGFTRFGDTVDDVAEWLTPLRALEHRVGSFWSYNTTITDAGEVITSAERVLTTNGLDVVGIYALAGLVLTACAFLLYRARWLESAGDVVAVAPMRPVFKYGVALCAGMALGVATSGALGGGEGILMAAILVWGVIGCFAAQMLLDKSFRVLRKWKGPAAVAGVFALLFLVAGFDLTGYETRIPAAESVESLEVSGLEGSPYLDDDGDYIMGLEITDPAQIEQFIDLHRAAVDQRDDNGVDAAAVARVSLKYTLTGGSTLSRQYWVVLRPGDLDREGSAAWAVQRLYDNRELYWRVYGFDGLEQSIALEGGRLESAELRHWRENQGQGSYVAGYGADARALLDAVEEDFRAGRIGVRRLSDAWNGYDPKYVYDYSYGTMPMPADTVAVNAEVYPDSLIFRVVDPANGGATLARLSIALQPTAQRTLDALEFALMDMEDPAGRQALEECLARLGR